jgi:nicotinic acid mononucleotide adenylyltransferase
LRGGEARAYCLRNSAGESAPFYLLPDLHVEVSASAIREQVRAASNAASGGEALLPAAVAAYIRARGLYR